MPRTGYGALCVGRRLSLRAPGTLCRMPTVFLRIVAVSKQKPGQHRFELITRMPFKFVSVEPQFNIMPVGVAIPFLCTGRFAPAGP